MNEIAVQRRHELLARARADLARIEDAPATTEGQAAKAVRMIYDSYPQSAASSPDVYLRQLRGLLIGVPLDATMALISPKNGIVTICTFLPTIAEVHKWLEDYAAPRRSLARSLRSTIETLMPAPEKEKLSPEAQAALTDLASKMKAQRQLERDELDKRVAERMRRTQRSTPLPELFALLDQTEAMNKGG